MNGRIGPGAVKNRRACQTCRAALLHSWHAFHSIASSCINAMQMNSQMLPEVAR